MTSRGPERRATLILQRSGLEADPEGVWSYRDARVSLKARKLLALRDAQVERVKHGGKEEKELHSRQDLSQAHPPADSEWDKVLRFGDLSVWVDEARRIELLGMIPEGGVHVNGVEQGDDLRVAGHAESIEVNVSEKKEEIISHCWRNEAKTG